MIGDWVGGLLRDVGFVAAVCDCWWCAGGGSIWVVRDIRLSGSRAPAVIDRRHKLRGCLKNRNKVSTAMGARRTWMKWLSLCL